MLVTKKSFLLSTVFFVSLTLAGSAQAVSWKSFIVTKTGSKSSLLTVRFEDNSKIGITPDQLYLNGNLGKNLQMKKQNVKTRSGCNNKFDPLVSCYTYTYLFKNIRHGLVFRGTIFHVMKGHWPHFLFPDEVAKHNFSVRL